MNEREFKNIKDIRYRRVLELIFEEYPSNVLDIGCSSGEIFPFLMIKKIRVLGIDIDFNKLIKTREKGFNVITADISKGLPIRNNTFDCVFAGEIIEHLIDTDYFLKEVRRVLKKEGILIISTPNLANLENRLRLLVGRYPIFVDYTSRGDNHVRVYTGRALIRQLEERGFKIEKYTGSFVPPISYSLFKNISSRLMLLLGILGSLFPNLAIHSIIKARRK